MTDDNFESKSTSAVLLKKRPEITLKGVGIAEKLRECIDWLITMKCRPQIECTIVETKPIRFIDPEPVEPKLPSREEFDSRKRKRKAAKGKDNDREEGEVDPDATALNLTPEDSEEEEAEDETPEDSDDEEEYEEEYDAKLKAYQTSLKDFRTKRHEWRKKLDDNQKDLKYYAEWQTGQDHAQGLFESCFKYPSQFKALKEKEAYKKVPLLHTLLELVRIEYCTLDNTGLVVMRNLKSWDESVIPEDHRSKPEKWEEGITKWRSLAKESIEMLSGMFEELGKEVAMKAAELLVSELMMSKLLTSIPTTGSLHTRFWELKSKMETKGFKKTFDGIDDLFEQVTQVIKNDELAASTVGKKAGDDAASKQRVNLLKENKELKQQVKAAEKTVAQIGRDFQAIRANDKPGKKNDVPKDQSKDKLPCPTCTLCQRRHWGPLSNCRDFKKVVDNGDFDKAKELKRLHGGMDQKLHPNYVAKHGAKRVFGNDEHVMDVEEVEVVSSQKKGGGKKAAIFDKLSEVGAAVSETSTSSTQNQRSQPNDGGLLSELAEMVSGGLCVGRNIRVARVSSGSNKRMIDSGCTVLMCPTLELFDPKYTRWLNEGEQHVFLGDDSPIPVKAIGKVPYEIGGELREFRDALYVPNLAETLISLSHMLMETDDLIMFTNDGVYLYMEKSKKVVAIGERVGKLYYLDVVDGGLRFLQEHQALAASKYSKRPSQRMSYLDWHTSLGHIGINLLCKTLDAAEIPYDFTDDSTDCLICQLVNFRRKTTERPAIPAKRFTNTIKRISNSIFGSE